MRTIEQDIQSYARGMRTGCTQTCIEVEQKYGLYGLPPEMVSEALAAVLKGEDIEDVLLVGKMKNERRTMGNFRSSSNSGTMGMDTKTNLRLE